MAGLFRLVYKIFATAMGKERPPMGVTKKKVSEDKISKHESRHKKLKRQNIQREDSDDESSKVGLKSPKLAQEIALALRPHSHSRSEQRLQIPVDGIAVMLCRCILTCPGISGVH